MVLDPNDITTVMDECRVELTGVSDAQLKSTMYEVMTEFFRDTMSWKEQVTFTVTPPTTQPTTSTALAAALTYPIGVSEGQIIMLDGVYDNATGTPVPAIMPDVGQVLLRGFPNQVATYVACVSKNVELPLTKDGYPRAPEWVLKKWHLVIKAGMLGALYNQKSKSYSDGKGGAYWLSKFRGGVQTVRSATLRANVRGAAAWRFPQGFRTHTQQGGVPSFGNSNGWGG